MPDPSETCILLVDDTESNRYVVGRHLRRAGYHVLEAASGQEALRMIQSKPDLVILDVKLPDMNGMEISRMLRNQPETRSLPILQLSATFVRSGDRVRGLDAGADAYLVSPVEPEELLAHVRTLLRLKSTQEALERTNARLQDHVQQLQSTQAELQAAQDQLGRQNEELEKRVKERTSRLSETINDLETFSYSITHDMRAPLRAMQGFARILVEDYGPQLPADAAEYLQRIAGSAARLDLLIRDVLSYSNIIRAQLKLVPVDTDRLLRDILREYPDLQPPKAEIFVPKPLPPIMGNEAFLTQCFSNLLNNAVKFVPAGVRPRVEITWCARNDVVRFSVTDNGIGIARHHQERLFELFQRAHTDYPGTGVGLAVVRKAVERMGGSAGVQSEAGKGSTFWFELHRSPDPAAGSPVNLR